MLNKIKTLIIQNNLIINDDYIIVGVSGGVDSMTLLFLLLSLKNQLNFDLKVIHINHNLRKEESLKDEILVETFCLKNNLKYKKYSCDLKN